MVSEGNRIDSYLDAKIIRARNYLKRQETRGWYEALQERVATMSLLCKRKKVERHEQKKMKLDVIARATVEEGRVEDHLVMT